MADDNHLPPVRAPYPPPHIPLYRVCGGGGGWLSNQRPDARTWARLGRRRISPRGVIVPHRNRTRFLGASGTRKSASYS